MRRFLGAGAVCVLLSGCAMAASPVTGIWSSNVMGPLGATSNAPGTKMGRACATSILGLIASGDASIDAARRAGSINTISSVDYESKGLLGITASFCTIVRGN
jgi:hypothetical protein